MPSSFLHQVLPLVSSCTCTCCCYLASTRWLQSAYACSQGEHQQGHQQGLTRLCCCCAMQTAVQWLLQKTLCMFGSSETTTRGSWRASRQQRKHLQELEPVQAQQVLAAQQQLSCSGKGGNGCCTLTPRPMHRCDWGFAMLACQQQLLGSSLLLCMPDRSACRDVAFAQHMLMGLPLSCCRHRTSSSCHS